MTNAWFGDYVSEYNFAESVKDNATVPLYYVKRVPEVELQNDFLDSDFAEILEDENLTDAAAPFRKSLCKGTGGY